MGLIIGGIAERITSEGGRWVKAEWGGGGFWPHLDEGSWPTGLTVLAGQSLTQGLLPNNVARAACEVEFDLQPTGTATMRSIEFVNASSDTRRIYWLNSLGQRVLYRTLAAGQRYVQRSAEAHSWVVTDIIGTCQAIYVVGGLPGKAVLR